MKKNSTIIVAILSAMLVFTAYIITPTYSEVVGTTTVSEQVTTQSIGGYNLTTVARRKDTVVFNQDIVQINVSVYEGLANGTLEYLGNCSTDPYPYEKIFPSQLESKLHTESIPTEIWDGITFLVAPGGPGKEEYVKYNHPDNLHIYRPNQTNINYDFMGTSKLHQHIAEYEIEDGKKAASFEAVVGGVMAAILVLLSIPEPFISKVIAMVLAAVAAVLTILGLTEYFYLNDILQTELGDGWSWAYDFGSFFCFYWWRQSFGSWRD